MRQVRALLGQKNFYVVLGLAIVLGALAGLVSLVFIHVMKFLQNIIWTSIPSQLDVDSNMYTLLACAFGGLIVGVLVHFFGEYPETIEQALSSYKKTHAFDYKHIPQAFVIAVASLAFGAALGPEAGLTAIIGGLATWIGLQLKKTIKLSGIEQLTVASVVGAVLHSPVGGAFIADASRKQNSIEHTWLRICGVVAGLIGWQVFVWGSSDNYFNLGNIEYSFRVFDLLLAVVPIAGGIIAGVCLALLGKHLTKLFLPLKSKRYISATLGGIGLGILVIISPLILFSGHEGIRDIVANYQTMSAGTLIGVGLLKTLAAALCLSTGWKGGQFFPSMFAGAAVGVGLAVLIPEIPAMIGLAAGLSATLGILLKKPVAAVLLAAFFFPISLWPAVVLAAVLGALASKKITIA